MAARDTIQVNDLGAAPGFEALQNHPAFGQDRYQIHPECMFGGGAFISAEVEELAVWSSLTAEGTWAAYENDGTQGGDEPTVTSSATVRTTGKNTISVAWDPSTTGQQSQYVDYPFPAVSNTLAYKPYVRIWARSDGTMAAGELTLSFLDSSGAVIGSAINFPALGTANVWIACEFDIQSLHSALIQAKPGPHYIRITNTNSAAADTNLFFNPIAYDISNGSGPVMGHCLELVADDARTRGTFMRAQPGYEREALVGASNSVAVYGPVIAGQSSTSVGSANTAFIAPANGGDSCWVQVTGMIWPTCGAGGGTIWYPASLTSSTAVDDEEAVGQEVGTFIETATAGGNYAVNLSSFASGGGAGGGVAFANVVRDNVANTAEAAFAITGETGSGAGAGVDIPLTGGVGGATDGAGGAVPLTGGAGGATNGVGGAVPITGGAGTGTGDGGAVPLIGGVGGATGTGGAGWLIGGDSAGAGGTAGPLLLDAGDPAGGTSANVVIAPVDAQAALVGRFAGTSKLISSCTHWEDNFLGQALNGLWNAHNGGGAAAAAAIATNAERGGVDLTCGTANGASAYAGLHMLQHNFDAANGTITLAATISLSSVANGEFRFGLMETAAGAEANPVVYGGDHVTAVLDVSTSADWYFGGELVAPATSSITALTKRLVYVITVDASGNTTFSVYDPSTPAVAPSTFSVASATNTTAVMSPYFYCGYEDNTSRTMTLERFEIWQD